MMELYVISWQISMFPPCCVTAGCVISCASRRTAGLLLTYKVKLCWQFWSARPAQLIVISHQAGRSHLPLHTGLGWAQVCTTYDVWDRVEIPTLDQERWSGRHLAWLEKETWTPYSQMWWGQGGQGGGQGCGVGRHVMVGMQASDPGHRTVTCTAASLGSHTGRPALTLASRRRQLPAVAHVSPISYQHPIVGIVEVVNK